MILAMVAHITFDKAHGRDKIELLRPNSVQIESSWKTFGDKASIILPRNVSDFDSQNVREVFQVGDPVTIRLGYNGFLETEFIGFISKISAGIPIVLECEDHMWQVKQVPVNISLRKTTLQNLLETILPGWDIDALEIEIGPQRFASTNAGAVLDYLKQKFSLHSYMKGKQLVVGKIYQDDEVDPVNLHLEKNVVSNALNYRKKEDVSIKITAISTLYSGKKIKVVVGDTFGANRQLSYYGIEYKAELKKLAEEDLKKYKVDGYSGSVTTFGDPQIFHGWKVNLESDLYPDRSGQYYVESVKTTWDDSPKFHREVSLGEKVTV